MKPIRSLLDHIAALAAPRRSQPSLYQRCLAVHLHHAAGRSALAA